MANQTYKIKLTALDQTKAAFRAVKNNLTQVKNTAMGVTTAVGRTTSALSKAAVSFGLVAAAVGATIKATLDYADAVGKSATRTGLSTDLIQALQIAFIEAGASAETAEKALTKFTRSVGDAQKGLKTYSDIFRDLGVEIEDSTGKFRGEEVVLLDTVDAISRLSSTTERATVMANLFGRSGIIIADAFKGGSDGVKEFVRRLNDLGIGLNEQGIRNAETLNDSMFVLTKQFNTIKDEILLGFIPVFQDVVNFFQKYFHELSAANGGTQAFAQILAKNAITALANFLDAIGEVMVEVQKFGLRIGITKLEIKGLVDGLIRSYDEFVKLPFVIGLTSDQIAGLFGLVKNNVGNFIEYTDEIRELKQQFQKLENPSKSIVNRLKKLRDEVGENTEAYATLTEFIEEFRKAGEANELTLTDQQSAFERYRDELLDDTKQIQDVTINAFKKMEDALVNFVTTGKGKFTDLVNSIIQDLIRLAIKQQIVAPLFGFITGQDMTKAGAGVSITGTTPIAPSYTGGGYTGMGARAGGIDGKGGFPAILHPNESIIDHSKGQTSNVVINQSVNFATGVQDTVKNEVLQLLPEIAETSKGAVLEAMSRGGNFRRGLR